MASENGEVSQDKERKRSKKEKVNPDDDDDDDEQKVRKRSRKKRSSTKDRKEGRSSSSRRDRDDDRDRNKKKKRRSRRSERESKSKRKKRRRKYSSSSSDSSDDDSSSSSSDSSSSDDDDDRKNQSHSKKRKVVNTRLLAKLAARGETLDERETRRSERRAARITAQFGYTPNDNPFNDPNIAEPFTWKKRVEAKKQEDATNGSGGDPAISKKGQQDKTFEEIEKVRNRRKQYEEQKEEMERIKAEESKMKELENYDEWMQKEELFHLQQQRHRSAIRLVEGREKPIDVLAKNLLMFGLTDQEKDSRAAVKYREKYNALEELENLEAELEEPHTFLSCLKLNELQELLVDIEAFRTLEREVGSLEYSQIRDSSNMGNNGDDDQTDNDSILMYWDALHLVTKAEIQFIQSHDQKQDNVATDVQAMFEGQAKPALETMKEEVEAKVKKCILARGAPVFDEKEGGVVDLTYWQTVLDQLLVHLAKMELSDIHSKMLVCQLEKLEKKKDDLEQKMKASDSELNNDRQKEEETNREKDDDSARPEDVSPEFGNLEEELGLTSEIDLGSQSFTWQDRFRPRKPRYFNRVKTGYDWNTYNRTHYDYDNPPPKTVQGYKFNIFYPDLIDKTTTPRYVLETTDSPDFCIIRFTCGPPYEVIAFKIINRQWNKSRKHGFRCSFDRGVLSLYFNFAGHWYRR